MDNILSEHLIELISISATMSVIIMSIIQQAKDSKYITNKGCILLLNFILSFIFGTPFVIYFNKLTILDALWVSIFSFFGAPSLYTTLKNQKIINYTPKSLNDENKKIKKIEIFENRNY